MNIKRFVAPDMRQAIRRVREEHGPDAVILKSQRGPNGVEVLSAMDFDEKLIEAAAHHQQPAGRKAARPGPAVSAAAAPRKPAASPQRPSPARAKSAGKAASAPVAKPAPRPATGAAKSAPRPAPAAAKPAPAMKPAAAKPAADEGRSSQMLAVTRELRSIRGLLQSELASLANASLAQQQPVRAEVIRKLIHLGMDAGLSRRITEGLHETRDPRLAWREALYSLARRMPQVEYDLLRRGGRIAFYGPTGVGKTTTITKLATLFAERHGRQSVGLIGADTQRPGAQREMLALGQQLGVYTLAASSPAEIREALDVLSDRRLVLIDTMGVGHRDDRLASQRDLMARLPQVEPWLVLAANIQRAALNDMIRHLAVLKPRGCVLTKIDECAALGGSLSAIISRGLPLGFVSNGQGIPDDISAAEPEWLVRRMVGLAKERQRGGSPGRRQDSGRAKRRSMEVVHG